MEGDKEIESPNILETKMFDTVTPGGLFTNLNSEAIVDGFTSKVPGET